MAFQVRNPTSVVDQTGIGTVVWSLPANAKTEDGTVAVANLGPVNKTSHYLWATSFNFSIPSGATIDGIVARVKKRTGVKTIGEEMNDAALRLIVGGAVAGNDKASATYWPGVLTWFSYGTGTTDKWGLTPTDTQVNASNFGLAIAGVDLLLAPGSVRGNVDAMELTVYYTIPSTLIYPYWYFGT